MDRRQYQRVVLLAGLLFLFFTVEGVLAYRVAEAEKVNQQMILGNLVIAYPNLEAGLVQRFFGKNEDSKSLTAQEWKMAREKGEEVSEKYGYKWQSDSAENQYQYEMLAVLCLGVIGVLGIFVSERKQTWKTKEDIERLRQQKEELEIRFELVTKQLAREEQETKALITDISHQLKTPIASLKMEYEIIRTTQLTQKEKDEFEQKGYEEVQRLEHLLEALLNLSKLETKLIQLTPSECSLNEILKQAVSTVYMKAYGKAIEITLEEFADQMLNLDVKWTSEAFVNLLDNAVKYSPEDTTITIRVKQLMTYIMIEIQDHGIGILPEEKNDIFKRFYRGNDEAVKHQHGSGVGLYLTRKIIEEQGGTVSVKSRYPKGSIFRVTLPLKHS